MALTLLLGMENYRPTPHHLNMDIYVLNKVPTASNFTRIEQYANDHGYLFQEYKVGSMLGIH